MNLLLSRILKYLNGTFLYDDNFKIATFIVYNFLDFEDLSLESFVKRSGIEENSILAFCKRLGFHDYESFRVELIRQHMVRVDQIRARMLGVSSEEIIHNMDKNCSDEEMAKHISTICEAIFKARKVVLFGALYPVSIAVELQTDLITFGKPVIQYHTYDKDLELNEDDVTIFITATGRSMEHFVKVKKELAVDKTTSLLITQNKIYTMPEHKISDYVIHIPGKFDGINFNYEIMTICDLLRVHYYTQYYL